MSADVVSSSGATASDTTFSASLPSGTADGNLLVAIMGFSNSVGTSSSPSGWARAGSMPNAGGGDSEIDVWWKIASSESTPSWVFASSRIGCIAILRITGHEADGTPLDLIQVSNTSGTSHAGAALTPSVNDTLLLSGITHDGATGDSNPQFSVDTGSGWSTVSDLGGTGSSPLVRVTLNVAKRQLATAASVSHTQTSAQSDICNHFILSIKSAAADVTASAGHAAATGAAGAAGPSVSVNAL